MSHRFAVVMFAFAVAISTLLSPAPATSQVVVFDLNPATSCVTYIIKYYDPNQASPTFVGIAKYISTGITCSFIGGHSAGCFSDFMTFSPYLSGTASGPQIGNNPSCSWLCADCGSITIDTSDGLPVELMDFSVE